MGKMQSTTFFTALLILLSILQLSGQNIESPKIIFLNAPVLFKEGGKSFQQVVATAQSEKDGKIVFTKDGQALLKADMVKGTNRFLLTFPAVTRQSKISITTKIDDNVAVKYPVTLVPPISASSKYLRLRASSFTPSSFTLEHPNRHTLLKNLHYLRLYIL